MVIAAAAAAGLSPVMLQDLLVAVSLVALLVAVRLGIWLVARRRVREREELVVPAFRAEPFTAFLAEQEVASQVLAARRKPRQPGPDAQTQPHPADPLEAAPAAGPPPQPQSPQPQSPQPQSPQPQSPQPLTPRRLAPEHAAPDAAIPVDRAR